MINERLRITGTIEQIAATLRTLNEAFPGRTVSETIRKTNYNQLEHITARQLHALEHRRNNRKK